MLLVNGAQEWARHEWPDLTDGSRHKKKIVSPPTFLLTSTMGKIVWCVVGLLDDIDLHLHELFLDFTGFVWREATEPNTDRFVVGLVFGVAALPQVVLDIEDCCVLV